MIDPRNPYARHYASLSISDLLDAREAYHVHLMQMDNVFATAVGLYRIRHDDLDYASYHPAGDAASKERGKKTQPRTMENTVVQPWSWPCVLVFVWEWLKPTDYASASTRGQVVPPFLFLPDGRVVPTCVVQASLWDGDIPPLAGYQFTSQTYGGGYPVLTRVQGRDHVGSIGCIVSDGVRHYALTNEHVSGAAGSEIFTLLQGDGRRIGVSAARSIRSLPFRQLYPSFTGESTRGNLDAGLIDVEDIADWTAQIFGLGVLGPVIEFNAHTASLDWIGTAAYAHGAHSGDLRGEVKALFYRYRTMGGIDYVSDFLIGGCDGLPLKTMPGDSGTLWCIKTDAIPQSHDKGPAKERKPKPGDPASASGIVYRPFAMEWGGQKLASAAGPRLTQYALAASLAVICRELGVEVITDLNAEQTQYWGAVGHYKIAERAVQQTTGNLKQFLAANIAQLTYPADVINGGSIKPSPEEFVPLADVPDVVWKSNINRGGEAVRPQENWNHYASMDLPGADGKTLFQLCGVDEQAKALRASSLVLQDWIHFYRTAPPPSAARSSKMDAGSLPFRVWQIFDAMVAAPDASDFLCAAGILAHYVGDACQPLHSSMHSDGLNGASTGVHGAYEEVMVDKHAPDLAPMLDALEESTLEKPARDETSIRSGRDAGLAIIELMARAHRYLPPTNICNVYESLRGSHTGSAITGLWEQFGNPTARCISDGARTLGQLWQAAYNLNKHAKFAGIIDRGALKKTYERKDFLPSLHLANLDPNDYPAVMAAP